MPTPDMLIEDYALIGDCETAALVGRDGSIDWLCWPRFDSHACFARLLGSAENGRWLIAPAAEAAESSRRYVRSTLVLETTFRTDDGAVRIVDFMPIRGENSDVVRIVVGEEGKVRLRMDLALRFGYGQRPPWLARTEQGDIRATAGPHMVVLRTPVEVDHDGADVHAEFDVEEGQRVPFVLTYSDSHLPPRVIADPEHALEATLCFWDDWIEKCEYEGPWSDLVRRSLVTVKALTYRPTGGVVAAPTTSLPEKLGGPRNWDYRYCWIRDATFTLMTLMDAGFRDEAQAWTDWLLRAVAGDPRQVQPLYGVAGEAWLPELIFGALPGYEESAPVRVGNAAFGQHQLDIFGEVMDVMHHARLRGLELTDVDWTFQKALLKHLEEVWRDPDEGIWEVRSGRKHFVFSKVMAWVAFDRGIKAIEKFGRDGPLDHWRNLREEIHAEVCRKGVDPKRKVFVQHYETDELDAANLLIPLVGFVAPDDPLAVGTVEVVRKELMQDGLILRYRTDRANDGLPPGEGTFLACSFWLVDNLVLQGRYDEARDMLEHLMSLCNDVGLLAEEFEPASGRMLGNFPQALSHLSLVNSAYTVARATGPAQERAEEGG